MGKLRILSSELRMDDGFLRVTFDRAIDPEGHELGRAIVHHEGSAVILPVNDKGHILLLEDGQSLQVTAKNGGEGRSIPQGSPMDNPFGCLVILPAKDIAESN